MKNILYYIHNIHTYIHMCIGTCKEYETYVLGLYINKRHYNNDNKHNDDDDYDDDSLPSCCAFLLLAVVAFSFVVAVVDSSFNSISCFVHVRIRN